MEEKEILDTSVIFSKGEGTVTIFTLIEHPPSARKGLNVIFPDTVDYVKALEISNKLREKGKPVGAIDIIIAGMCLNRSAKLLAADKDFEVINDIFPEFKLQLI